MSLAIRLILLLAGASSALAADLAVMSFNLRYGTAADGEHAWPHRRPHVVEVITEFGPDLLGTQECLAFQRDELLAALPTMAVVGVGRDDGAEAGEMCACFYRRERFELRDSGTFWLSETPDVVASRGWDAALPRIVTWLRLHDRAAGREVLWANTHFDHLGVQARLNSARLLHDWLAANRGDALVVVTGDFNAAATDSATSAWSALLGAASDLVLTDTWAAAHPQDDGSPFTFHGFGKAAEPGRIDGILVSPGLTIRAADIVRTQFGALWPSDHFPVTARLATND
jgi:endonuclease/exonuclease/phosphatase family metal-dependent hydrolase